MKRVIKPAGTHDIVLEEVPLAEPGPQQVRIKAVRSLISRGSETGRRRTYDTDTRTPGYSLAGAIDATGSEVEHLAVGDRVAALFPHAQYVVADTPRRSPNEHPLVALLPATVTFDQAPYWPLVMGGVVWVDIEQIQPNDVVVIMGQGLVGSMMMQVAKTNGNGRIVAVDALDSRCALADELGADVVINAAREDPVKAVLKLTNGVGADIVAYAVGGPAGPKAFEQALDMLAVGGLLHLVGLYEQQPLPLYSSKIQRRRLLGGYYGLPIGIGATRRALDLIGSGAVPVDRMTTHHYPYTRVAEAFDLLDSRLDEAMGVLLDWDVPEA